MVIKIDGFKEVQQKENSERQKFKDYLEIAAQRFKSQTYSINSDYERLGSEISIYFSQPNEDAKKCGELLRKIDSANMEEYNDIVHKSWLYEGFHSIVDISLLRKLVIVKCPEAYPDAKKMAEDLERRFEGEIVLKTTYCLEGENKGFLKRSIDRIGVTKHKLYKSIFFH